MNKRISLTLPIVTLSSLLFACSPQQPPEAASHQSVSQATATQIATIEIANPSEFVRTQQPLYLSYHDLGLTAEQAKTLVARVNNNLVPSQHIDRSGDGNNDTLFVALDFAAAERIALSIFDDATALTQSNWPLQTQAEISHKIGGEWQNAQYIGGTFQNVQTLTPPAQYTDHSEWIRYEGPGIESDKVGYRFYLDWRNGFDIFGKKISNMVLQQVGLDGYKSYHEMANWGMDILKVGKSLGAGGYGYWDGQQVQLVSKVGQHTATVTNNGPLYSALQINYQDWQIADKTLTLTADLSMTAGSRLVYTRLHISDTLDNIAVGLVKLPDTKVIQGNIEITGHAWTYLATWGNQSLSAPDSKLGMAVLFKRGTLLEQTSDENSHVAVLQPAAKTLEYYFLAAWDGEANGITTEAEFIAYLEQQVEALTLTPRMRYNTAATQAALAQPLTAERALYWGEQLAASEMTRQTPYYAYGGWDFERRRPATFEYTTGLLLQAYDDLLQLKPNPEWQQMISDVVNSFVTEDGNIRTYDINKYNIDSLNTGNMLLRDYLRNPTEKARKALALLRRQVAEHPRTSGGAFWHKKIYPHQLWLDGVYMGMPFYAFYTSEFENGADLAEVVKEFTLTRELLRDPKTGLYFHAWDESKQKGWADKDTGLSPHFWSRGQGWLTMALVDVLDFIPVENTELRAPLLQMISELAETLTHYQHTSGTWYQILDMPKAPGNYLESSGSAMYAYFFAKALNKGYLPANYQDTAIKAFNGLLQEFILVHPDNTISLINTVQVAGLGFGRDGSYQYYMSEPLFRNDAKANGPFIMAATEMAKLLGYQVP
ncbi:MAG: glycoside hydrolase family 88 protein [Paraglaciecola sp.]|uniref:glycoside hydrolase family 88 protein n=1 Tax=Alishewanella sp. SMS8 TaxID=2994676 RepID=UPI002740C99E|nr:glycoside hydrolase family 88 protein [Alishewanella sp. SMS8]MDP5131131.1 glycoside hydrolase family 88 protein [Paraglaciecola sp.]MDP5458506.1 glycoside hydrolase family 88 protein [Alishewanella sp. SMS8]